MSFKYELINKEKANAASVGDAMTAENLDNYIQKRNAVINQQALLSFCPSELSLERSVLLLARTLGEFTADDLHVLEKQIASRKRDSRVIGVILKSLHKKGEIEPMYYVKSTRKECHGRPILKWRLKQ